MAARDEAVFAISVAARKASMAIQNLRVYERRGLVDPDRTAGGTRLYSEADVARLARTGKVDMPATLGGTAVNVAPRGGSAESPVRCSTTGTPRASSSVWTGRSPRGGVASMLTESIPTSATPWSASQVAASVAR